MDPTPKDTWSLVLLLKKYKVDLMHLDPYEYFNKDERIELDKATQYFNDLITDLNKRNSRGDTYEELYTLEKEISNFKLETLPRELLLEAKQKGFADRQIAHMLGCLESQIHALRMTMNINRVFKLVDTCAAEFKALTPYYYSTFEAEIEKANGERYVHNESIVTDKKKNNVDAVKMIRILPEDIDNAQ